jgi:quercetin dioxygenase-like cupin family protein
MEEMMSLEDRAVRYKDLQPCTNAFIDTRSPGSDKKENFTIIGPGVAENPNQHVHIKIPHGFNIGGARQPTNCLNSQHSHLTEEVFVVHTGKWDFITGVDAVDGRVSLDAGDIISIPMDIFRGFECIQGLPNGKHQGLGYLHAILGGDNPGRVLWAPKVFDMAKDFGLVLLEDGSLIDTTAGQTVTAGKKAMSVTSEQQIAEHRFVDSEALNDVIIRTRDFDWRNDTTLSQFEGVSEVSLIGGDAEEEGIQASKLGWKHGFVVRGLKLLPGAKVPAHQRKEEEVIFVHQGSLCITVDGASIELVEGDNFTTPISCIRTFSNISESETVCYVTRRGDRPQKPIFR